MPLISQASSHYIKDDLLNHFVAHSKTSGRIPSGPRRQICRPQREFSGRAVRPPDRFLFFPAQLWPHKNTHRPEGAEQIETEYGLKVPLVLTGRSFRRHGDLSLSRTNRWATLSSTRLSRRRWAVPRLPSYGKGRSTNQQFAILEAAAAVTRIIASRIPPLEELGQVPKLNLFDPIWKQLAQLLSLCGTMKRKFGSAQTAHNRNRIGFYLGKYGTEISEAV